MNKQKLPEGYFWGGDCIEQEVHDGVMSVGFTAGADGLDNCIIEVAMSDCYIEEIYYIPVTVIKAILEANGYEVNKIT